MTRGTVLDAQICVEVVFLLPSQATLAIECVVDTGFAGALTLSPESVVKLGLPFLQEIDADLANDTDVATAVHVATIIWEGAELDVAVLAMGRRPLLGTALLNGHRLIADFAQQGDAIIERLLEPTYSR